MSATVIEQGIPGIVESIAVAPPKHRPSAFDGRWIALLLAADITMFLVATLIAMKLIKGWAYFPAASDSICVSTIIYASFCVMIFERLGLYQRSFAWSVKDEVYYIAAALGLGALPQFLLFTFVPSVSSSRAVLLLSLAIATLTVGASRAALHVARKRMGEVFPERICVVGHPSRLDAVLEAMNFSAQTRVLPLAEGDIEATLAGIDITNGTDLQLISWLRQARAWGADTIVMTEVVPPHLMPILLEAVERDRIKLAFAPPRLCAHAYEYSIQTHGHQTLIVPFRLRACRPFADLSKRALDVSVAALALLVAAPVMIAAALAIAISDRGPIFFRQERVGRNGRTFNVLKFRTMKVNAEATSGPVWASVKDPRKTRLGSFLRRTSIDELPQIFNVLRGEMSLVGPRPERPVFVESFRHRLPRYDERHLVRPGITGWSQVHMKRALAIGDVSEKLSHDLFYIENWSFFLDVSIIVKTGFEFLFHRAA